jgi:hypothetical protein
MQAHITYKALNKTLELVATAPSPVSSLLFYYSRARRLQKTYWLPVALLISIVILLQIVR